jgi:O-acetyl-ADP-ribose deacetylase (regulator of RNase III)
MIEYRKSDITTVDRGIVAHGVNCQGRMGKGIALAIRRKWPESYGHCLQACKVHQHLLGKIVTSDVGLGIFIAHCFTQQRYGNDGLKYADTRAIRACFESLDVLAKELRLPVYMPRIGCGLGGLDWRADVEPLLSVFSTDTNVVICTLE